MSSSNVAFSTGDDDTLSLEDYGSDSAASSKGSSGPHYLKYLNCQRYSVVEVGLICDRCGITGVTLAKDEVRGGWEGEYVIIRAEEGGRCLVQRVFRVNSYEPHRGCTTLMVH